MSVVVAVTACEKPDPFVTSTLPFVPPGKPDNVSTIWLFCCAYATVTCTRDVDAGTSTVCEAVAGA